MGWTVNGIKRQVSRLKTLPLTGREWSDIGPELDRVLKREADDDDHAQRIIDAVLDVAKFCPTPAEILTAAEAVRQAEEGLREEIRPDPQCSRCDGSGSVVVVKRDAEGRELSSAATRCDCWARRPLPRWPSGEKIDVAAALKPIADARTEDVKVC